ncbi:hypothetical protein COU01_00365 [Candidatus Falkowbacteria bacterium CG10_big_fil_rev_8_21_14_0_10_44_15]|uniref:Succinylglutamate desuccinylase/Aspartoacylase catalytic domain-containing protein n=1 Tax=Candidatus Falkowbacteria bacterium CG10_big_fil_rev_8_21_14_0_10_44_15 TaxID=1974569 RepID=A0A2H0V0X6_9BACT|nr:MAG: hypothetical protein COU01_00365 [Candidatus Falkowbacteria bacterium CG10_big_fil_rev_8_21_14_0_10_44_15]
MHKKVLFIAGTHGDETIGTALLKKISKQRDIAALYDSVIGNPRACVQNKRFIEADLNRVAPGDVNSPIYEVSRASELVEMFKNFEYIIDFHETKANDRIVIIIPRFCRESLALALAIDISTILIWPPALPGTAAGPLTQYAPFGIEIECGTKNSFNKTLIKLEKIVKKFLENKIVRVRDNLALPLDVIKKKKFYLVYGKINPNEVNGVVLQDFGPVDTGQEKFTALLFGKHQNLKGYKMRPLDSREVLDILTGQ